MSKSDPNNPSERREYFRIKNKLFMSYEIIESDLIESNEIDLTQKPSPQIQLLRDLNTLEQDNIRFCKTLDAKQDSVITFIEKMNTKIAALAEYAVQSHGVECDEFIEVDISGGGIRFEIDKKLPISQNIKMEIMLLPQYYNLTVLGKVVDCEIVKSKNVYKLAVAFEKIQETDRDAIVGHVFKMQSKQLRAIKENENQSSKDGNISLN